MRARHTDASAKEEKENEPKSVKGGKEFARYQTVTLHTAERRGSIEIKLESYIYIYMF